MRASGMAFSTSLRRGSGVVRAKAWKKGETEPTAWTIEVPHRHAHQNGSPGLFGFAPLAVTRETPAGSRPGTAFTISRPPTMLALIFLNGQLLTPAGVDYTLAGSAITTALSIKSADNFTAVLVG